LSELDILLYYFSLESIKYGYVGSWELMMVNTCFHKQKTAAP